MCVPSTIFKEFRNSIFTECYKNPQEGKKKRTRDRHLSSATSSFFFGDSLIALYIGLFSYNKGLISSLIICYIYSNTEIKKEKTIKTIKK